MSIEIRILEGPLSDVPETWTHDAAGAIVSFEGVVRLLEDERALEALDYEAYQPMADNKLRELAQSTLEDNGLLAICVEHSRGRVPVGKISFRLRIAATHRKEAIRAMDAFIDRLKQDVPIWKKPVYVAS